MKSPKPKPCKQCGTEFVPRNSLQKVCLSLKCALAESRDKRAREAKREARIRLREGREKLMTRSDWMRKAQVAFNAWVRLRDAGRPCIACSRPLTGKVDASHYKSVGACPELRFDVDNVHASCVHCNQHKSGNIVEYRINLVKRIGADRVAELEGPHEPKKYTVAEIRAIEADYKARVKAMTRRAA